MICLQPLEKACGIDEDVEGNDDNLKGTCNTFLKGARVPNKCREGQC